MKQVPILQLSVTQNSDINQMEFEGRNHQKKVGCNGTSTRYRMFKCCRKIPHVIQDFPAPKVINRKQGAVVS